MQIRPLARSQTSSDVCSTADLTSRDEASPWSQRSDEVSGLRSPEASASSWFLPVLSRKEKAGKDKNKKIHPCYAVCVGFTQL